MISQRVLARTLTTVAATTGILVLAAPLATAGTTLPYSYRFSGLSGATDGVKTPTFSASGRVCVDSTVRLDKNSDGAVPDYRVRYSLVVPNPGLGSDKTVASITTNTTFDTYNCFPSQPAGTFYVSMEKVQFQSDLTIAGFGSVQRY